VEGDELTADGPRRRAGSRAFFKTVGRVLEKNGQPRASTIFRGPLSQTFSGFYTFAKLKNKGRGVMGGETGFMTITKSHLPLFGASSGKTWTEVQDDEWGRGPTAKLHALTLGLSDRGAWTSLFPLSELEEKGRGPTGRRFLPSIKGEKEDERFMSDECPIPGNPNEKKPIDSQAIYRASSMEELGGKLAKAGVGAPDGPDPRGLLTGMETSKTLKAKSGLA